MADPTDRDAELLDAWLDGDRRDGDDLTVFAGRVMRDAAVPAKPSGPSREQRERIRAQVLGGAPNTEKARQPVETITFTPNGAKPAPTSIPIREPERPAPSKLSILMTAALVAIIAVAGLALARGSIDLPGGGDPAPTGLPALAYSPVASPAVGLSCDRDQWSGIFTEPVPDLLADATYLRYDDGTLTLHCGGESEQIAIGVRQAFTYYMGVVAVRTADDAVHLLNVISGDSLEMAPGQLLDDDGTITFIDTVGRDNWLLVPVTDERTDWQVIDLRSMESFLISGDLGGALPASSTPEPGPIIGSDVAIVSWPDTGEIVSSTPLAGEPGVEQTSKMRVLVLPGSIESRRWIDVTRYHIESSRQWGYFQYVSVSPDSTLLAYTTMSTTSAPVIRVEDAVSGEKLVDVPINGIDADTRFILAGTKPHLAYSNGDTVRILALAPDAAREIAELPAPDVIGFLPTADPDTILASINFGNTAVTPINVTTGAASEFYTNVPPLYAQLFGDYGLPLNIVRAISDPTTIGQSIIQLVNPATNDVVLESELVDANPVQIVSFNTYLRDGGNLAVVPIGYNRAVVLDAESGETWEITAPIDDDRIWRFYPSFDGNFVTAYPEPPQGTNGTSESEYWVAPLKPGAEWVPLNGITADTSMTIPATPAG